MSTHVVVRSFPGPGGHLAAGTEVDASGWRNTEALVRRRYLRAIPRADQQIEARPDPGPAADVDAAKSRKR